MSSHSINSKQDLARLIAELSNQKLPFMADIKSGSTRTQSQNAYLFGVCYYTILKFAGEDLGGWTKNDLHRFFCGEYFGWVLLEGMGRRSWKPARTTTKGDKGRDVVLKYEFSEFVSLVHQQAAERWGVVIPDPE